MWVANLIDVWKEKKKQTVYGETQIDELSLFTRTHVMHTHFMYEQATLQSVQYIKLFKCSRGNNVSSKYNRCLEKKLKTPYVRMQLTSQ